MRIEERLRQSAARYGAQPAVIAGRAGHSYAELDLKSERLAAALQAGGVARGARVAVFLDGGWEAVVSAYAVFKAGGILVPIDAEATAGELSERLCNERPVAVVTQSRLAAMVATAIASLWSVKLIVLVGGDRARAGGTCISFEATVGRIGRAPALAAPGGDGDPAVLFGGEAPLTHGALSQDVDTTMISGGGIALPPIADRAGLSRLLAAIDAGHTMIVGARLVGERDAERRMNDRRSAEPVFGIAGPFDGVVAGGAPVFQR